MSRSHASRVALPPEFLAVREAAAFIGGISEDYLRRSNCPRIRLGTRIVFWVEDLRRFALARRTPPLESQLAVA